MIVTIDVTQEDIDRGRCKDCRTCPIALAILRVIRPGIALLSSTDFVIGPNGCSPFGQCQLKIPRDAVCFIGKFDYFQPVQPFSFPLDIPGKFLAPGVTP